MNCEELKQDIALAAIGCLPAVEMKRLQEHTRTCSVCAEELMQLRSLSSEHQATAAELLRVQISADRLSSGAISHTRRKVPAPVPAAQLWRGGILNLRWLIPTGAAAGIVIALYFWGRPEPQLAKEAPPREMTNPQRASAPLPAGSFLAYRNALSEGGDESFNSLLARDADILLRPVSSKDLLAMRDEVY